jgi:hypothetical protein
MGNYTKIAKAIGNKVNAGLKVAGKAATGLATDLALSYVDDDTRLAYKKQKFDAGDKIGTPSIDATKKTMISLASNFVTNSAQTIEDPAFDCVMWQIDWDDASGLFADENYTNSALAFLKRNNEIARYNALLAVKEKLRDMFDVKTAGTRSYFLQSIDGLSALNENRRKRGVDSILSLHCFDNVKWELREISQTLEFIYYDSQRQLVVLPSNLRRFSCYLFITDARDLSQYMLNDSVGEDDPGNTSRAYNKRKQTTSPQYTFSTGKASKTSEFLQTADGQNLQSMVITVPVAYLETNPYPDGVSNVEPSMLDGTLSLNARVYSVTSLYAASYRYISDIEAAQATSTGSSPGKMKLGKLLGKAAVAVAKNIAAQALSAAKNYATAYAMNAANRFLDESGVLDAVNKALSFTKPDVLMAQFGGKITKALDSITGQNSDTADKTIHDMYFTEHRTLETYTAEGKSVEQSTVGGELPGQSSYAKDLSGYGPDKSGPAKQQYSNDLNKHEE